MKILIVDDDIIYLNLMERHLNSVNAEIMLESNSINALNIFKKNDIDLVISDLIMPEMDGIILLNEIKMINPDVFVILHSSHFSNEKKIEALSKGAYNFYEKPAHEQIIIDINIIKRNKDQSNKIKNIIS